MARLILHGVKRDGRGLLFIPSGDYQWWPLEDVTALISYLRTAPPVDGRPHIGLLGKVLDRLDLMPLEVARRIDHTRQ
jgi:hypothetical protein